MLKFSYYGHSAFLLDDGSSRLLFDPFLTFNPAATLSADKAEADYILVSHGHQDHLGDAGSIARMSDATVIGVPEIIDACGKVKGHGMNIGGTAKFPFGKVFMTPAMHSAGLPGAIACGFVVTIGGKTVYYSGDTSLFSDMALISRKFRIDYAVLPIGDNYTMGIEDAAIAAEILQAEHVIPVHYNTWPVVQQDAELFKMRVEMDGFIKCHILKPGEAMELE